MQRMLLGVALGCAMLAAGCIRCPIGTTRCDGNGAVACLSNGTWRRYLDCDEVASRSDGGAWVCCNVQPADGGPPGAACLPASECH